MKTTAVSVYDRDSPHWADRLADDSVDLMVYEPIGFKASSPRGQSPVLWSIGGALEPFFEGVKSVDDAEIDLDVWVNAKGEAYLGHKLRSGDLLVCAIGLPFVKHIMRMALYCERESIECVREVRLWLEDCRINRSKTLAEAFSKGSLYLHTSGGSIGPQKQVLWDATAFIVQ